MSALSYTRLHQTTNKSKWVSAESGLCRVHSKWVEVAWSEMSVRYRTIDPLSVRSESVSVGRLPVCGSSCVSLLTIAPIRRTDVHSPLACPGPAFLSSCRPDGRLLVFIHRPAPRCPGLWILYPDHVSSYTGRACEHTVDDLRQFWGRGQHRRERERGETLQKRSCQKQSAEQTLGLKWKAFTSKERY